MLRLKKFFPEHGLNALKWIGTKPWLDLIVDPEGVKDTQYKICDINNQQVTLEPSSNDLQRFTDEDFKRGLSIINNMRTSTLANCMFTHTLATAMATGLKLFQPTFEQCLVIENTKVTIPFDEYCQPFPVVTIELPEEYRRHLRDFFNHERVPHYVFNFRHPSGFVASTAWFGPDDALVHSASPLRKYATLEDSIARGDVKASQEEAYKRLVKEHGKDHADKMRDFWGDAEEEDKQADYPIAELTQRLGLNFSYALATMGTTKPKPQNEKTHKRNVAVLRNKKTNAKKKQKIRQFLNSTVYVVAFDQEITICPDISAFANASRRDGECLGDERPREQHRVKPHWRRGHWREQACGKELQERKRIRIDPVLVNKELFIGDLSDARVSMKIDGDIDPQT